MNCTRCDGTGWLNHEQLPETIDAYDLCAVEAWLETKPDCDVTVCDCCGDGEYWYGTPGRHYSNDDPPGNSGPYAYNGGRCECH